MPHIGLDLLFLAPGETGGMETYVRSLVPLLPEAFPEATFTVFAGRELAEEWREAPWHQSIALRALPVSSSTRIRRSIAELTLLHGAAARTRVDLVHGLSAATPLAPGLRTVATIYDLIYFHYPQTSSRLLAYGQSTLTRLVARRAERVIVPSLATRNDLVELIGIDRQRIDVVAAGPGRPIGAVPSDQPALRSRLGLPEGPIVLSVSARRPHKNLERLIEAVSRIDGAVLVLPGYRSPFDASLLQTAERLGVSDRVVFAGWISDEDLEGLYLAAACMVFPSLAEGFGLPVLEAMARGLPVATSNVSALPEVAGDAALFFDPESVDAIEGATRRLLTDDRFAAELTAAGLRQAAQFSWRSVADGTANSYRRALGGPPLPAGPVR